MPLGSIYRTSKKAVRFKETCLDVIVVVARVKDEVLYTFFVVPRHLFIVARHFCSQT
jgi:hypothetical protein